MKLYEIKDDYLRILENFRNADGEEELARIADDLGSLQEAFSDKLENCARVLRTLEAESEAYKQEASRLRGKANIIENRAERLKDYIALCLGAGNNAKTALFDFSWRKSHVVEVDSVADVPEGYMRTKTISEPDKLLLKQDLKMGLAIEGVRLVENMNLVIK